MPKTISIASLQLGEFSKHKLDYYLTILKSKRVRLVSFGEYTFEPFFKSLIKEPLKKIEEISKKNIQDLKKLAFVYNIVIVCPLVVVQAKKLIKAMFVFRPRSCIKYEQGILIDYAHWNEKAFFVNSKLKVPPCFTIDGFKFSLAFGYELHFNSYWEYFSTKKIDCVLLSTASTFGSKQRWREIIKTRAFLGSYYILRTNKIGKHIENKHIWKFYGDSFLCDPYGNIEEHLRDLEELLIVDLDKMPIRKSRKEWGFNNLNESLK